MSLKSITPIPTSAANEPAGLAPMPDLSALRQGWSKKPPARKPLPSFPNSTGTANNPLTAAPQTKTAAIPALPNQSAPPEQGEFSIDYLDDLLASTYPEQASKSPSLQASGHSLKKDTLPQTASSMQGSLPQKSSKLPIPAMEAMPSDAEPQVSLPLVRDQFIFPIEEQITPEPPATPQPAAITEPTSIEEAASVSPPISDRITEKEKKEPQPNRTTPREQTPSSRTNPTERPEYTDEDLRDALSPMIGQSVDKFLYTPNHGVHTYLEPMLRSTVRRAIAEQMDDISPFQDVTGWDKFSWKMRALFSSRSYEDVVFDYTQRYQVEEVYLLRRHTRSLISYASNNPSRHVQVKKVQGTVKKIASKYDKNAKNGEAEPALEWEDDRQLIIRRGDHCTLIAIIHGSSNAILKSDLDYALRQAEERFGQSLEEENDIHLQILQPLLEGCLLIKAPAIPN